MDKELDEVLRRFKSKLIGFGIITPLFLILFSNELGMDWALVVIALMIFNLAMPFIELEYKNFVLGLVIGTGTVFLASSVVGEPLAGTVIRIGYIFLSIVSLMLGVVSYIKRLNKIKNKQGE